MTEGVDYSFSRPSLAGLRAAGKSFVGRYLPTGSGKDLTKAEAADIKAAGLNLFLYYEETAGWMLGGFNAGVAGAKMAAIGAADCEVPLRLVYFAADTGLTESQVATVLMCLKGAASVLGKEQTGVYHSTSSSLGPKAVAAGYALASAHWSGDPTPGARLHQYQGNTGLAGGSVDLVRSLVTDYGQCWFDTSGGDDVALTADQEKALGRLKGRSDGWEDFYSDKVAPASAKRGNDYAAGWNEAAAQMGDRRRYDPKTHKVVTLP